MAKIAVEGLKMEYKQQSALADTESLSATQAKNEFGQLLEKVIRGARVVITKHEAPKAVLISIDEFEALLRAGEAKLNTLTEDFDALLARMQTSKSRRAMKAAFQASPKALGKASVTAARKRG